MPAVPLGSWAATSIANTTTVAVTVTSAVPVGSRIIVVCNRSAITTTTTGLSCADNRGNTYVLDAAAVRSATHIFGILSAPVTTALQAGDTITVTGAATTRKAVVATAWSGVGARLATSGTTVPATAATSGGPNGSSLTPIATSSVAAQGLVISASARAGTATVAPKYGSTDYGQAMTAVGSGDRGCALAYRSDKHVEAQPGSWALSTSQGWAASTVTYQITGGMPPITATFSVVVGGSRKQVTKASVIVGGVKKPVTTISVIIGGEKIHAALPQSGA